MVTSELMQWMEQRKSLTRSLREIRYQFQIVVTRTLLRVPLVKSRSPAGHTRAWAATQKPSRARCDAGVPALAPRWCDWNAIH